MQRHQRAFARKRLQKSPDRLDVPLFLGQAHQPGSKSGAEDLRQRRVFLRAQEPGRRRRALGRC